MCAEEESNNVNYSPVVCDLTLLTGRSLPSGWSNSVLVIPLIKETLPEDREVHAFWG